MIYNHMYSAIDEAKKAFLKKEIPVGAIIVRNNEIIARAHNLRETNHNSLHHAEILAIDFACKKLQSWRLDDCEMYITLEPCPMCAGAIINSKIKTIYFGAYDYNNGAAYTHDNVFSKNKHISSVEVYGGILEKECSNLLKNFFKDLRCP